MIAVLMHILLYSLSNIQKRLNVIEVYYYGMKMYRTNNT